MMNKPVPGRAYTPEQKRDVVEALYAAWLKNPSCRLGQFIEGARHWEGRRSSIFHVEDDDFVLMVQRFADHEEACHICKV